MESVPELPASTISISFIILTWNSKRHIGRCIDSLYRTVDRTQFPFEIWVVDNGSSDSTTKILQRYSSDDPEVVKPIFLPLNRGTTYSRNIAIKKANGEYFCVLDSDVELLDGTVAHLAACLHRDPTIGLIAPRLIYGNGMLQKSTDTFPTIFTKLYRFFFLKIQEKVDQAKGNSNTAREVDYAISAFWLFRSSLIERVGLLDENIFFAPEDVDFCLRIWQSGLRILYDPAVSAIHNAQEIARKIDINRATLEHIKGLAYYFRKHGYCVTKPPFPRNLPTSGSGD